MLPLLTLNRLGILLSMAALVHRSLAPPRLKPVMLPFTASESPLYDVDDFDADDRCDGVVNRTTVYVRSEGVTLVDVPAVLTLVGKSLSACAQKCTQNAALGCRSFEYDAQSLMCTLKQADAFPFSGGGAQFPLVSVPPKQQHGVKPAHFQRVCLPNSHACSAPFAFERFPQRILAGHSMEVLQRVSLPKCLAECLDAQRSRRADCRSAMFYHGTSTCILNREHRRSVPERFVAVGAEDNERTVDYFDNNCFDVDCSEGSGSVEEVHWLRTEDFSQVDPAKDLILSGVSNEECRQSCASNRVHDETFPCRAFVFTSKSNGNKGECQLSAESAVMRKRRRRTQKRQKSQRTQPQILVDTIDSEAGEDDDDGDLLERDDVYAELSAFSAGHYHEKVCLAASSSRCGEASFELFANRVLDSRDRVLSGVRSVSACLSECLGMGAKCTSLLFDKNQDECVLNAKSQFSHPELFRAASTDGVDYYDNLCRNYEEKGANFDVDFPSENNVQVQDKGLPEFNATEPFTLGNSQSRSLRSESEGVLNVSVSAIRPAEADTRRIAHSAGADTGVSADVELETECRLTGIEVIARFAGGSRLSGALFLYDHSNTCAVVFTNASESRLIIPFPAQGSNVEADRCPGQQTAPFRWFFLVVLRQNFRQNSDDYGNGTDTDQLLEARTQLVTGNERVFNVTCDFSALLGATTNGSLASTENPESTTAAAEEKRQKPPANGMIEQKLLIRMEIWRDGLPVTAVTLGDALELRWTLVAPVSQSVGFSVDECKAERLGGEPAASLQPQPQLMLITKGLVDIFHFRCPEEGVRRAGLLPGPIRILPAENGFNTSLRAFRFDGSQRVRIRCSLSVCVERCPEAKCSASITDSTDLMKMSSRRKRRTGQVIIIGGERRTVLRRRATSPSEKPPALTIAGSYTILGNSNDQLLTATTESDRRPSTTPLIHRTISGINGKSGVGLILATTSIESDQPNGGSAEVEEGQTSDDAKTIKAVERSRKCGSLSFDTSSPPPSRYDLDSVPEKVCVRRPFLVVGIALLAALSVIQTLGFIRCFLCHRRMCESAIDDGADNGTSEVFVAVAKQGIGERENGNGTSSLRLSSSPSLAPRRDSTLGVIFSAAAGVNDGDGEGDQSSDSGSSRQYGFGASATIRRPRAVLDRSTKSERWWKKQHENPQRRESASVTMASEAERNSNSLKWIQQPGDDQNWYFGNDATDDVRNHTDQPECDDIYFADFDKVTRFDARKCPYGNRPDTFALESNQWGIADDADMNLDDRNQGTRLRNQIHFV